MTIGASISFSIKVILPRKATTGFEVAASRGRLPHKAHRAVGTARAWRRRLRR